MKILAETYGCTMNHSDTEQMLGRLKEAGHTIVEEVEESDLIIVNTCAVTRTTLNKVVYRLEELSKKEGKKVLVAGCLPLIDIEKVDNIGEFSGIISCLAIDEIVDMVEKISKGEKNIRKLEGETEKGLSPRFRKDEVSAPISIAEGCTSNCAYCCVKNARGNLRSFDPDEIYNQVKDEVENGRKQVYITTQDTGAYGLDLKEKTRLPDLLDKLVEIPKEFRIRVGMMNPNNAKNITSSLLDSYENEKIYNFLHIPVQSGSDRILKKMKRSYKVDDYLKLVNKFREKFPDIQIATDIIVGFPSETKEEFQKSMDLLRKSEPDKVNITRFTPMPNTKAEKMDQIDSQEKKRRSKRMTKLVQKISSGKNQKHIGDVKKGLVIEKGEKGGYKARIQNYKLAIIDKATPGEFVNIEITDSQTTYLEGKKVE